MRFHHAIGLWCCAFAFCSARPTLAQTIQNPLGVRMMVSTDDTQPVLWVVVPGHPDSDHAIRLLLPEHVTGRRQSKTDAEHLYVFRPGQQGEPPVWRKNDRSLEYEREFAGGVHFHASATLEDDGIRVTYTFVNRSDAPFEMIYAVTDPRMGPPFRDVRLERTYVHHKEGFDLLASETPQRLTMPLSQWLPARYLASYMWPVPTKRAEKRDDNITYYNKSRAVDMPLVATLSEDRKWVVASFTNAVGNVWSNPELTCQHVDPSVALAPGESKSIEVKILIFPGTLDQVLKKVKEQRSTLKSE